MIQRMKSIIYLCRLTCDSCLPLLRTSGSEIVWALGFELGSSVDMVLLAPVGSPLGYSINMLLGLALANYFVTWEVSLAGVSLGALDGLIIETGEGCLVVLSLGLSLGPTINSPNTGLIGIILEMSVWNLLVSLLEYIWHINWCDPWLGTWQLL